MSQLELPFSNVKKIAKDSSDTESAIMSKDFNKAL